MPPRLPPLRFPTRRRRRVGAPRPGHAGSPAADPWVAVLAGTAPPDRPVPPGPPPVDAGAAARALVRADAAGRLARRLTGVTGEAAVVLATVGRGDEVTVVLRASVPAPRGWRADGDRLVVPTSLTVEELVALVPDEPAEADPAALDLVAADGTVVTVDVGAVGVLGVAAGAATVARVRALVAGLVAAPLAAGLDVVTVGLPPACVPAVAHDGRGRLHALGDDRGLVEAVRSLVGTEEPVVVVATAAALPEARRAELAALGVGLVLAGGGDAAPPPPWRIDVAIGGAVVLEPLGLPLAP